MRIRLPSGRTVNVVRQRTNPADQVKRWQANVPVAIGKGLQVVRDPENEDYVVDYLNVTIRGYLSTWQETTPEDVSGDYVVRGAFRETLPQFMAKNPVMLRDHGRGTEDVVGHFTKAVEDSRGLYVEAMLSNAPDLVGLRFRVAEGHLRTLSMGGIFHYLADGRGIGKVDLWEGSIVAIPANPDALFSVRGLNQEDREFMLRRMN
jgi:HK97 family phage prohead protease